MGVLKKDGGVYDADVVAKLMSFGFNSVHVFQGMQNGFTHQIQDKFTPHLEGNHYMAHHTNLIVQICFKYLLWSTLKTCFSAPLIFFHHPNRHIELFKLENLMKLKGNKILRNVKTHWISMLSSTKWVMLCNPIVQKMVENNPYFMVIMVSFELLCDANLFTFFFLFVAFVANNLCTNEICTKARHFCFWLWYNHQNESWTIHYSNHATNYVFDIFKEY